MTAYDIFQQDKFFSKWPKDKDKFVIWCQKINHPLTKEDSWMLIPLKKTYIAMTMYSIDVSAYLQEQIKITQFARSRNEKEICVDMETE